MHKALIYLVCMLFAFMTISHQAFACSAPGNGPSQDDITQSDRAFIGRVIKTKPVRFSRSSDQQITIFRVTKNIKGRPAITLKFRHDTNSGMCGMKFIKGESYIVAGKSNARNFYGNKFHLSNHTARLANNSDRIRNKRSNNTKWVFLIAALITTLLLCAIFITWKRRANSA